MIKSDRKGYTCNWALRKNTIREEEQSENAGTETLVWKKPRNLAENIVYTPEGEGKGGVQPASFSWSPGFFVGEKSSSQEVWDPYV